MKTLLLLIFATPLFWPLLVLLAISTLRQINEYERGVMFTMGKFTKIKKPGWRIRIPVFQRLDKVDMRVKAVDVPNQRAITKDNISVDVNAVIYSKVADAQKAILEVENFWFAVSQLAHTTMRNVAGEMELDELGAKMVGIAKEPVGETDLEKRVHKQKATRIAQQLAMLGIEIEGMKVVKEYGENFEELFKNVNWTFGFSWKEVYGTLVDMPIEKRYKLE